MVVDVVSLASPKLRDPVFPDMGRREDSYIRLMNKHLEHFHELSHPIGIDNHGDILYVDLHHRWSQVMGEGMFFLSDRSNWPPWHCSYLMKPEYSPLFYSNS